MKDEIIIKGARLHNLKNVTVTIPKNKLVVLTGLSGSGKSSLAFDILHKEGQRQYMESMGLVTDYLSKPPVDSIEGLSPTISVDQHLTNRSPRSTVGTETEIFTYLRILFAKIGHRPCPKCGSDIAPPQNLGEEWMETEEDDCNDAEGNALYPCSECGTKVPELSMSHFSFNKLAGACPSCTGLGVVNGVRLEMILDESKSFVEGGVYSWDIHCIKRYTETLTAAARHYGFTFDPEQKICDYGTVQRELFLYGVDSLQLRKRFPGVQPPETAAKGRFEGIATNFLRRYAERIEDQKYRDKMEKYITRQVCPDCGGERLREESRRVRVAGRTIVGLSRMPLSELAEWINVLTSVVAEEEWAIVEPIVNDLRERIKRILNVGIGYLTMERSSPTLSGGEAQRLRLASLLGSGLSGVIYVLDEPSIGLHQRDTELLIHVLYQLRDLGNTVVVIEHDLDIVRAADYIIDVGPGAGRNGGTVTAAGPRERVADMEGSVTGRFLSGRTSIPVPEVRRKGNGRHLEIRGACEHNLRNIDVRLPLGMLIALTGVSGSGKSSLAFDILDCAARKQYYGSSDTPGRHSGIHGWEWVDNVITIDQQSIGRIPRSNAATYTDAFSYIRKVFASTEAARIRGLTEGHFSFNVPGGRCEKCQGAGTLTIGMHFLPDVQVRCPVCKGKRFKQQVLEVRYNGLHVADILDMTIEQALPVFREVPAVWNRLSLMVDCGLGYLQLGQPATTLSGGEAQRIKLAKELARKASGHVLYLLDEPTTGLHPADTANLLKVLHGLVDAGNTVIVVEHNLDVVKTADWVIDLGPEGGDAGGCIIAEGTPETVAGVEASYTGRYLRKLL